MKNILRGLLLAPILLVAGCCANSVCNCDDLYADSLYFLFKTTGPNAFAVADVDTVYLLRYASTVAAHPSDSAAIIRAQDSLQTSSVLAHIRKYSLNQHTIILSNNQPFTPGSNGKLSQFTYKLRVRLGNSRRNRTYEYGLTDIKLAGQYQADGCCTCYENTQKGAFVNGRYQNFTESGRPVVDTLARY